MILFLEQASLVQTLIENVIRSLDCIQDDVVKSMLMESLEPFSYSIIPTTIDVNEIKTLANEYNASLTDVEALKILDNICLDIDLNCVNDSIRYHFDNFIVERIQVKS